MTGPKDDEELQPGSTRSQSVRASDLIAQLGDGGKRHGAGTARSLPVE